MMRAPLPPGSTRPSKACAPQGELVWVPRGLLARAAFRRAVGDGDGARRDLDEAQEIAEPGPMRLYLCDCALERARLALARREAFAPLNGLVETEPAAARSARRGRGRAAPGGSAQRARRGAQADRGLRISPPRRGACRARRGRRGKSRFADLPAARVSSINPGSVAAASSSLAVSPAGVECHRARVSQWSSAISTSDVQPGEDHHEHRRYRHGHDQACGRRALGEGGPSYPVRDAVATWESHFAALPSSKTRTKRGQPSRNSPSLNFASYGLL